MRTWKREWGTMHENTTKIRILHKKMHLKCTLSELAQFASLISFSISLWAVFHMRNVHLPLFKRMVKWTRNRDYFWNSIKMSIGVRCAFARCRWQKVPEKLSRARLFHHAHHSHQLLAVITVIQFWVPIFVLSVQQPEIPTSTLSSN